MGQTLVPAYNAYLINPFLFLRYNLYSCVDVIVASSYPPGISITFFFSYKSYLKLAGSTPEIPTNLVNIPCRPKWVKNLDTRGIPLLCNGLYFMQLIIDSETAKILCGWNYFLNES